MANAGLLLLSQPRRFARLLPIIQEQVKNTLYVEFYPYRFPSQIEDLYSSPTKILSWIYHIASGLKGNVDVRVLLSGIKRPRQSSILTKTEVDVVFLDNNGSKEEMNRFVQSSVTNVSPSCEVVDLGGLLDETNDTSRTEVTAVTGDHSAQTTMPGGTWSCKTYDYVVLGGTFDRLHSGHKILLSEAVLRCSKKLTVGVTDSTMLKSKTLWELIEPCPERMKKVEDFLKDVDPSLKYEVVPISDPYGPTKDDPLLQLIVVSEETVKGGQMVNALRTKNGLSTLDMHIVDLLEESIPVEREVEECKISSSNLRIRLLGTRLRTPELKPHLPPSPYVIGFTGGIASGKSSMCKRLEPFGVGIIDCDKLAHKLYQKGEICYPLVVEHFGESILDDQGEVDRKKLGPVVFKDKEKMKLLNSILWPRIMDRAKEEIQDLYKIGHEIVVMEAAMLLQAGWDQLCHEVWSCIISPNLAVERLTSRGLSVTEAQERLASQPENCEFVSSATVVFCTEWHPDFSQSQINKAWNELQNFLAARPHE